jgi:hypothetical protein
MHGNAQRRLYANQVLFWINATEILIYLQLLMKVFHNKIEENLFNSIVADTGLPTDAHT